MIPWDTNFVLPPLLWMVISSFKKIHFFRMKKVSYLLCITDVRKLNYAIKNILLYEWKLLIMYTYFSFFSVQFVLSYDVLTKICSVLKSCTMSVQLWCIVQCLYNSEEGLYNLCTVLKDCTMYNLCSVLKDCTMSEQFWRIVQCLEHCKGLYNVSTVYITE